MPYCSHCECPEVCTRHYCALQIQAEQAGWNDTDVADDGGTALPEGTPVSKKELKSLLHELIKS